MHCVLILVVTIIYDLALPLLLALVLKFFIIISIKCCSLRCLVFGLIFAHCKSSVAKWLKLGVCLTGHFELYQSPSIPEFGHSTSILLHHMTFLKLRFGIIVLYYHKCEIIYSFTDTYTISHFHTLMLLLLSVQLYNFLQLWGVLM